MLCVTNCKKINKCIGNQQCNRHLYFPGQHYSFQGFFQTFPYLWSFSRLFKALKISTLNSRTFHTFPGSVRTLVITVVPAVCPLWPKSMLLSVSEGLHVSRGTVRTHHMSAVKATATTGTVMFNHRWKMPETAEFLSVAWTQWSSSSDRRRQSISGPCSGHWKCLCMVWYGKCEFI